MALTGMKNWPKFLTKEHSHLSVPPLLVPVVNIVTGFAGNAEFSASHRLFLAIEKTGNKLDSPVHQATLFPGHLDSSIDPNCVTHVSGIQ